VAVRLLYLIFRQLVAWLELLAAMAADVKPQEVAALVLEVDDARLVLVEGQAPGRQPRGYPRLDLLGFLSCVAQRQQVIRVDDQDRGARCRRRGIAAKTSVTDSGCLFHAVKGNVHQDGTDGSSNAIENLGRAPRRRHRL
jgi:hypothetical protein